MPYRFLSAMFIFSAVAAPAHSSGLRLLRNNKKEDATTNLEHPALPAALGSRLDKGSRKLQTTKCDLPGYDTLRHPLDITLCMEIFHRDGEGESLHIAELQLVECKKEAEDDYEFQMWQIDDNGFLRNAGVVLQLGANACILVDSEGLYYHEDCSGFDDENTKWEQTQYAAIRPQFFQTECLSLPGEVPEEGEAITLKDCNEAVSDGVAFFL